MRAAASWLWRVGLTWIVIMSGAFSLLREGFLLYLAITNQPAPPSATLAVFGHLSLIAFILSAGAVSWREHMKAQVRETARHKAVTECFQCCAEVMEKENRMPFNALVQAKAYELETSEEVVRVCIMMKAYGCGDPFVEIDKIIPDEKRLEFLKFFRWSPKYDKNNKIAYLDAAQDWATRFGTVVPQETKLKFLIRKILR